MRNLENRGLRIADCGFEPCRRLAQSSIRNPQFGVRYLAGLFLLSGALVSLYGQARVPGFPPGKWWKDRRIIEELKLGADQQARIESIWLENRARLIDQKADLDKSQLDLTDLLSGDSVDEAAALKIFERVQAARQALEKTTFLMRIRTKNILSPEQQQKLEEISERVRRERGLGQANQSSTGSSGTVRPGTPPPPRPRQ